MNFLCKVMDKAVVEKRYAIQVTPAMATENEDPQINAFEALHSEVAHVAHFAGGDVASFAKDWTGNRLFKENPANYLIFCPLALNVGASPKLTVTG